MIVAFFWEIVQTKSTSTGVRQAVLPVTLKLSFVKSMMPRTLTYVAWLSMKSIGNMYLGALGPGVI